MEESITFVMRLKILIQRLKNLVKRIFECLNLVSQNWAPMVNQSFSYTHLSSMGPSLNYNKNDFRGKMTITAAIVLFAILWFLILFIALPLKIKTQQESGEKILGTPSSAPEDPQIRLKMLWVTIIAFCLWLIVLILIYLVFLY